jgi:hypothetical protein
MTVRELLDALENLEVADETAIAVVNDVEAEGPLPDGAAVLSVGLGRSGQVVLLVG